MATATPCRDSAVRDDTRVVHIPQFLAVVRSCARGHNKQLSINMKERFEARPCLARRLLHRRWNKTALARVARDLSVKLCKRVRRHLLALQPSGVANFGRKA